MRSFELTLPSGSLVANSDPFSYTLSHTDGGSAGCTVGFDPGSYKITGTCPAEASTAPLAGTYTLTGTIGVAAHEPVVFGPGMNAMYTFDDFDEGNTDNPVDVPITSPTSTISAVNFSPISNIVICPGTAPTTYLKAYPLCATLTPVPGFANGGKFALSSVALDIPAATFDLFAFADSAKVSTCTYDEISTFVCPLEDPYKSLTGPITVRIGVDSIPPSVSFNPTLTSYFVSAGGVTLSVQDTATSPGYSLDLPDATLVASSTSTVAGGPNKMTYTVTFAVATSEVDLTGYTFKFNPGSIAAIDLSALNYSPDGCSYASSEIVCIGISSTSSLSLTVSFEFTNVAYGFTYTAPSLVMEAFSISKPVTGSPDLSVLSTDIIGSYTVKLGSGKNHLFYDSKSLSYSVNLATAGAVEGDTLVFPIPSYLQTLTSFAVDCPVAPEGDPATVTCTNAPDGLSVSCMLTTKSTCTQATASVDVSIKRHFGEFNMGMFYLMRDVGGVSRQVGYASAGDTNWPLVVGAAAINVAYVPVATTNYFTGRPNTQKFSISLPAGTIEEGDVLRLAIPDTLYPSQFSPNNGCTLDLTVPSEPVFVCTLSAGSTAITFDVTNPAAVVGAAPSRPINVFSAGNPGIPVFQGTTTYPGVGSLAITRESSSVTSFETRTATPMQFAFVSSGITLPAEVRFVVPQTTITDVPTPSSGCTASTDTVTCTPLLLPTFVATVTHNIAVGTYDIQIVFVNYVDGSSNLVMTMPNLYSVIAHTAVSPSVSWTVGLQVVARAQVFELIFSTPVPFPAAGDTITTYIPKDLLYTSNAVAFTTSPAGVTGTCSDPTVPDGNQDYLSLTCTVANPVSTTDFISSYIFTGFTNPKRRLSAFYTTTYVHERGLTVQVQSNAVSGLTYATGATTFTFTGPTSTSTVARSLTTYAFSAALLDPALEDNDRIVFTVPAQAAADVVDYTNSGLTECAFDRPARTFTCRVASATSFSYTLANMLTPPVTLLDSDRTLTGTIYTSAYVGTHDPTLVKASLTSSGHVYSDVQPGVIAGSPTLTPMEGGVASTLTGTTVTFHMSVTLTSALYRDDVVHIDLPPKTLQVGANVEASMSNVLFKSPCVFTASPASVACTVDSFSYSSSNALGAVTIQVTGLQNPAATHDGFDTLGFRTALGDSTTIQSNGAVSTPAIFPGSFAISALSLSHYTTAATAAYTYTVPFRQPVLLHDALDIEFNADTIGADADSAIKITGFSCGALNASNIATCTRTDPTPIPGGNGADPASLVVEEVVNPHVEVLAVSFLSKITHRETAGGPVKDYSTAAPGQHIIPGSLAQLLIVPDVLTTASTCTYVVSFTTNGKWRENDVLKIVLPPTSSFEGDPVLEDVESVAQNKAVFTLLAKDTPTYATFKIDWALSGADSMTSTKPKQFHLKNVINSYIPLACPTQTEPSCPSQQVEIYHFDSTGSGRKALFDNTRAMSAIVNGAFLSAPVYTVASNITQTTTTYNVNVQLRQAARSGDYFEIHFTRDTNFAPTVVPSLEIAGEVKSGAFAASCSQTKVEPSEDPLVAEVKYVRCPVANIAYFTPNAVLDIKLQGIVNPKAEADAVPTGLYMRHNSDGNLVKDEINTGSNPAFEAGNITSCYFGADSLVAGSVTVYRLDTQFRQAVLATDKIFLTFPFDTYFESGLSATATAAGSVVPPVVDCVAPTYPSLEMVCTVSNPGDMFQANSLTTFVLNGVANPPASGPYTNLTIILTDKHNKRKDYNLAATTPIYTEAVFASAFLEPHIPTTKTATYYDFKFRPSQHVRPGDWFVLQTYTGTFVSGVTVDASAAANVAITTPPAAPHITLDIIGTNGTTVYTRLSDVVIQLNSITTPIIVNDAISSLELVMYNSLGFVKERTHSMGTSAIEPYKIGVSYMYSNPYTLATTSYVVAIDYHQAVLPTDKFEFHFPAETGFSPPIYLSPRQTDVSPGIQFEECVADGAVCRCTVVNPGSVMGVDKQGGVTARLFDLYGIVNPPVEHPALNNIKFALVNKDNVLKDQDLDSDFPAVNAGLMGPAVFTPIDANSGITTNYVLSLKTRQAPRVGDHLELNFPDYTGFTNPSALKLWVSPTAVPPTPAPDTSNFGNCIAKGSSGVSFLCPIVDAESPVLLKRFTTHYFVIPGVVNPPSHDGFSGPAYVVQLRSDNRETDNLRDTSTTASFAPIIGDAFAEASVESTQELTTSTTTYTFAYKMRQAAQVTDYFEYHFLPGTQFPVGDVTPAVTIAGAPVTPFSSCSPMGLADPAGPFYKCTVTTADFVYESVARVVFENVVLPRQAYRNSPVVSLRLMTSVGRVRTASADVPIAIVKPGTITAAALVPGVLTWAATTTYTVSATLRTNMIASEALVIQFNPATTFDASLIKLRNNLDDTDIGACILNTDVALPNSIICTPSSPLAAGGQVFKVPGVINPPRGYRSVNNLIFRHVLSVAGTGIVDEAVTMTQPAFVGDGLGEVRIVPRDTATKATTTYDISVSLLKDFNINESILVTFAEGTVLQDGFTGLITSPDLPGVQFGICEKFHRLNVGAPIERTIKCNVTTIPNPGVIPAGKTVTFSLGPVVNPDHAPMLEDKGDLRAETLSIPINQYQDCVRVSFADPIRPCCLTRMCATEAAQLEADSADSFTRCNPTDGSSVSLNIDPSAIWPPPQGDSHWEPSEIIGQCDGFGGFTQPAAAP